MERKPLSIPVVAGGNESTTPIEKGAKLNKNSPMPNINTDRKKYWYEVTFLYAKDEGSSSILNTFENRVIPQRPGPPILHKNI